MSHTNPALRRMNRHPNAAQLQRGRENYEALRAQHEHDEQQAIWKAQQMANRDKSPMGFVRPTPKRPSKGSPRTAN